MAHSQSFEAIVLKTYDVGEADRFCVLFTRESGRIAARASGARRLTSRLGGALLPFRHVMVELKEGSGGWIVAGASMGKVMECHAPMKHAVSQFTALEEGIELLLRLVTDEGALPDVFDATISFINACMDGVKYASLGYSFVLLHHLGLLPGEEELKELAPLNDAERAYLRSSRAGALILPNSICDPDRLIALRSVLLREHLKMPLKTPNIAAAMA